MSEWIPPLAYGTWDFMHVPVKPQKTRPPTLHEILAAVSWFYEVPLSDLRSARRELAVSRPRQVYYFLAREMTSQSLPVIGRVLGGRDHKTVWVGVRVVAERAAADERLRDELDVLRLHIKDVAESRKPFGEVAA